MARTNNRLTRAVLRVVERRKRRLEENRPKAVPFMMEDVRKPKATDELERMSPQEREKLLGRVGIEEVRKMFKGGI